MTGFFGFSCVACRHLYFEEHGDEVTHCTNIMHEHLFETFLYPYMPGCMSNAEQTAIHVLDENSENSRIFQNGSALVDLFVKEIHSKLLEAFEKSILARSMKSKRGISSSVSVDFRISMRFSIL